MVRSMTGYGRFEAENEESKLIVEIKSVNHRYCDISVRLPRNLNAFENAIRKQVKDSISRGKVDVYVTYESNRTSNTMVQYNRDMAESYLRLLRRVSSELYLNGDVDAVTLSKYPEVFTLNEDVIDEDKLQELIRRTVANAIDSFIKSRETEGNLLKADLIQKLDALDKVADQIAARSPEVFHEYKERITTKVKELLGDKQVDERVIATELVIYSDKICVDEELVRLKSHIQHMKDTLTEEDSVGRKLDFIAQELNREANTTLSKANDIMISNQGIVLKTEIEKIREQIQNLE